MVKLSCECARVEDQIIVPHSLYMALAHRQRVGNAVGARAVLRGAFV
jgi:hypothetical protein